MFHSDNQQECLESKFLDQLSSDHYLNSKDLNHHIEYQNLLRENKNLNRFAGEIPYIRIGNVWLFSVAITNFKNLNKINGITSVLVKKCLLSISLCQGWLTLYWEGRLFTRPECGAYLKSGKVKQEELRGDRVLLRKVGIL